MTNPMSDESLTQFRAVLREIIADFELPELSASSLDQLSAHYAMLRRWNQRINLTRIIAPQAAARLHYAESLFGAHLLGEARTLLDVGSGAGFPGLPLAVARPQIAVTALEANHKKALFLNEAAHALSLSNFTVVRQRWEDFDASNFDLLTTRAVDAAAQIVPAIIAALQPHQRLLLYGSSDFLRQLKEQFQARYHITERAIPHSQRRLIARFEPL